MTRQAYRRRWLRAKRERWRQHGCCVNCGLPTPKNPKTGAPYARCFEHRLVATTQQKAYYSRQKAQEAAA